MTGRMPLIVVLGPTAIGKTGLAMTLAHALEGEIIGADSRQIYRGMDIGTAKPTPDQQRLVPHQLIDMVAPDESFGLAQYQRLAYAAIDDAHRRRKLPLLVGGTGQYLTAVIEGWSIPEVRPNDALRIELEYFAAEHGSESLHQRLQRVDPAAAEGIHHRNVRRVIRALEVFMETGTPISQLQQKNRPPYAIRQYGLRLERAALYQRADQRLDDMLTAGFVDEVRQLLEKGYDRNLPSMSGLGYAQLAAHLLDGIALDDARLATCNATHDFIRRQLTWFRGHDTGIHWLDVEQINVQSVVTAIAEWRERLACAS
ncbi:MAG: tRNA (adenosine(37)-N6)-dimethylallyltransferase MiaA [Anaerolineae bacterium]|nr:tRNA (adenosine(37)-N6)-dimethylallyltransferase MiaA [Anaerolineae bacterium]